MIVTVSDTGARTYFDPEERLRSRSVGHVIEVMLEHYPSAALVVSAQEMEVPKNCTAIPESERYHIIREGKQLPIYFWR
jgi:hypothetical protein